MIIGGLYIYWSCRLVAFVSSEAIFELQVTGDYAVHSFIFQLVSPKLHSLAMVTCKKGIPTQLKMYNTALGKLLPVILIKTYTYACLIQPVWFNTRLNFKRHYKSQHIPVEHVICCCFARLIKRLTDHKEKIIGKYFYTLVCYVNIPPRFFC